MARYVDGFVIPLPSDQVKAYARIARVARRVWLEHGALDYVECVGEDLTTPPSMTSFTKLAKAKAGETVVFSWITYASRAHRDRVNAKVMADPRLAPMMRAGAVPFDPRRMAYGGFRVLMGGPLPTRKRQR
jgi:uncharacterized protein YbaA (DUF1428 family)